MDVSRTLHQLLAVGILIGTLWFIPVASANTLPNATCLISFEQNGTPACTFADFPWPAMGIPS